jgi:tetratricopeptide (TPR) repeat protein
VRTEYRGELPVPIYLTVPYIMLIVLLPAPAIAFAIANRPKRERRRRRRRPPEEVLRELARRPDGADLSALRRAFLDAVGRRLRAPASALAEPEAIRRAARRAGTSGATAASAAAFIAELNTAAFAFRGEPVRGAGPRALKLYAAIDAEARRWRAPVAVSIVALCLFAGTHALAAGELPDADAQFAAGVSAYGDRHYANAAADFSALADSQPRAADAWANFGTASFAAGDTANAVRGWQRALRLEPLAADMRERLDITAPAPASSPGAVPPVPPLPVILIASLLWAASWVALALRLRRREPLAGASIALTALGAAIVCGCAGFFLESRLSTAGLSVARHDVPLRILPALGGERASVLHLGETVRVIARDGAWANVRVDRDRDGWVPGEALLPLAGD